MTNPLRELLNKKRDELGIEYSDEHYGDDCLGGICDFHAGADAMLELLMPVVEELEDAAFNFSPCISCNRMHHAMDALTKLRERLK